jgi:hypothetical protein
LPREWLGPTEELVPFGVSADDTPPPPTAISPPGAPSSPASTTPPSAQSFWTEEAASLHAALQGEPPPPSPPPADTPASTPRGRPPRRRPHLNARAIPVLTFGAIALGLIALIGSLLGSAHRPASARGPSSGARLVTQAADIGRSAADWRLLARVNQGDVGTTHSSTPVRKPLRAGRSRHPVRHSTHGTAPSSGSRSVVSYQSAATAQPVTTSSGTSATQVAAPINQSATGSARQDTSANTSNASNPSPASLLGPGHCACG